MPYPFPYPAKLIFTLLSDSQGEVQRSFRGWNDLIIGSQVRVRDGGRKLESEEVVLKGETTNADRANEEETRVGNDTVVDLNKA